ncbi:MAG: efflux RND transporter periplasmic adaptor subunit [Desulfobacterales bacterium]
MKKKVIGLAVVVLLLAAVAAGLWFFLFRNQEKNRNELVLYGNVDIRQVELAFNASERIAKILVREGGLVEKGQLLAVLDTARLQHDVDRATAQVAAQKDQISKLEAGTRAEEIGRARAQVEAAQAQADDLNRTYRRLRPLAQKNLIAPEQLDQAKSKADAAQAQLQATRQELELALAGPRKEDIAAAKSQLRALEAEQALAAQKLADASLFAPSDGIIQNRILEPGDMASPQKTVLTLALIDPLWIRAYVQETDIGKLFPGMAARVTTDSFPDKIYPAWIGYISPAAEFTPKTVETPELRTRLVYQVRVYVCNPQNELRLGMPATVIIPLDQSRPPDGAESLPPCKAI